MWMERTSGPRQARRMAIQEDGSSTSGLAPGGENRTIDQPSRS